MDTAPFFSEIADGPADGVAFWVKADDGVRLRLGMWKTEGSGAGTVLMFPGRTEYIELQGRTARDFRAHGYSILTIDWRGHGLSDRLTDDPNTVHVNSYEDYQRDVRAMVDAAKALDLPKPWFLFGNSMGACIGLRAVIEGLDVKACAFSAPMWRIKMSLFQSLIAIPVAWTACHLGKGHMYIPGHDERNYASYHPFEGNRITSDPDSYGYWVRQGHAEPSLQMGGSSMKWLLQSLYECLRLSKLPSPSLPCIAFWGDQDEIVDFEPIETRMSEWPHGSVMRIENAKHALVLEQPKTRKKLIDKTHALFLAAMRS
jgi:lysophospholipase